ncbi:MAG: rhodanese-like domain-containing protein [Oscillospiraceae bacterium]|nr:rhodanese-like domain-containing protein [Oscillospiraceae bacterium]
MAVKKVSFEEAYDLLTKNKNILLFDVREEEEYITGHAINAELFTLADINADSAGEMIPSKDTPVMVYCRSGARSSAAAGKLSALGYETVYDIGSLIGWPYGLV